MSHSNPDEAELSQTSPVVSPGEESDVLYTPSLAEEPEPKPGLDGKPVRCK